MQTEDCNKVSDAPEVTAEADKEFPDESNASSREVSASDRNAVRSSGAA